MPSATLLACPYRHIVVSCYPEEPCPKGRSSRIETIDPPGGSYEEYTLVELTANSEEGWAFDHWEGDLTGTTNPQSIEIHNDVNVTAVFTQLPVPTYELTVVTEGQATVMLNPGSGSYEENTVVQLMEVP